MAGPSLTQPLEKARSERPGDTFSVFGSRRRTNAEAVDRIARLAGALQALGLQPGDRVIVTVPPPVADRIARLEAMAGPGDYRSPDRY